MSFGYQSIMMIVVLPVPGPPMITMISALLKNKRQNYLNLLGFK
jgi:hypothetical protein